MTPQVLSEPQQCTAALKWTMECSSVKGWLLGGVIVTASICALFYIFGSILIAWTSRIGGKLSAARLHGGVGP